MKKWFYLCALIGCVAGGIVQRSMGDTIRLKTGKTFEGIILEESAEQIVFKQPLGKMSFKKSILENYTYSPAETNALLVENWKRQYPYAEEYAPAECMELAKLYPAMTAERESMLSEKRKLNYQLNQAVDSEARQSQLEKELRTIEKQIIDIGPRVRARHEEARQVGAQVDDTVEALNQFKGWRSQARDDLFRKYTELRTRHDQLIRRAYDVADEETALRKKRDTLENNLRLLRDAQLMSRDAKASQHGMARKYLKKTAEFRKTFESYRTPELQNKYPEFFNGIDAQPQRMESDIQTDVVTLRNNGMCLDVAALLNGTVSVVLLVDTGASSTTISESVARKLGLRLDDKPETQTTLADGSTVSARKVTLDLIEVGTASLQKLDVLVYKNAPGNTLDGLLGMNFLRHFDYDVSPDFTKLTLTRLVD